MGRYYRKPRAYLEQVYNGHFMLERTKTWIAKDAFGNYVTSASTRKDCEALCRCMGYCPEKDTVRASVLEKLREETAPPKASGPSKHRESER